MVTNKWITKTEKLYRICVSDIIFRVHPNVLIFLSIVFQLDADDAKVTFEEEPGQDVYCESQMPL